MQNRGVQLLKLLSAMHDTCNCANAVVDVLNLLKQENGMEILGGEAWAALSVSKTTLADYRCGNHTRGLPVAAFNRLFESYLHANLGEEFEAATTASGGRARLEKSGVLLLRSMCKLVSSGFGAYEKGDELEFWNWMEKYYPDLCVYLNIGRAELSKRQDWDLEAAAQLLPLVKPSFNTSLIGTSKLDPQRPSR